MPTHHRSKLAVLSGLFIAIGLIWVIGFWLAPKLQHRFSKPSSELLAPLTDTLTSAIVPVVFRELTIPYLRERSYQSSLGELQRLSETSTYTSYLTSYTSDGLRINGLLTQPKGPRPPQGWPAIVFVHGYIPPTLYKTQEKYVEYINTLARNGFVVFKIDLRGHGSSEGTPSGSYYSSGYVIDTLNAIAALEATDFVDKAHIGLWGHSMAGNIVMRSFAARPQTPAVVIWAGAGYSYEDLQKYGLQDNSYRPPQPTGPPGSPPSERQRLFEAQGQFTPTSAFWQQVAPTNYLGDLKGALQLHHAQDDPVVNFRYSTDLNDLLNNTSVPHELFTYPNGGHNITGANFSRAMQRTVEFYKKHLTPTQ